MIKKLKILYCKYFGHNWYDSTFARLDRGIKIINMYRDNKGNFFTITNYTKDGKPKRYDIIESEYCPRCGEYHETTIAKHLSRAELLKQGWFVEQD